MATVLLLLSVKLKAAEPLLLSTASLAVAVSVIKLSIPRSVSLLSAVTDTIVGALSVEFTVTSKLRGSD